MAIIDHLIHNPQRPKQPQRPFLNKPLEVREIQKQAEAPPTDFTRCAPEEWRRPVVHLYLARGHRRDGGNQS